MPDGVRFEHLVTTSESIAATPARSVKVAALAGLLGALAPPEVEPAVAMLAGAPRQGRVGVGWRTIAEIDVPAASEPSLTVADVDRAVDELAACAGSGSTAERVRVLTDLLGRATSTEQSFLRLLLSGGLRQGALEGVMADAVARAAGVPATAVRRAAMLTGDLPATARLALTGGRTALDGLRLVVGRPILPMLAASSADVASAIEEVGLASVEWKLDGARVQVHRNGSDVSIYTRNLNDVTARLPAVADAVRRLPVRSVVLDGEAVGFDEEARPGVFQDTMSSFGRHDGVAGAGLAARFFDVLHVDGDDLLDRPLADRLGALDAVAAELAVPRVLTDDATTAGHVLDRALASGHEGVMVKAAGSPYEAGRRGAAWRKVKPVRTLDLVVVGVEWGSGRRRGWLSNLHLAARDAGADLPPGTGGASRVTAGGFVTADGFVTVGKTFKGLTDALLAWQTEQLLARAVHDDGHVVVVRPELVVEVALDGVQRSTRYAGGVALRFARVRRYRPDRSPHDADTIEAVRSLRAAAAPPDG